MSDRIERELTTLSSPVQNPSGTIREHIEAQTRTLNTIVTLLFWILVAAIVFGSSIFWLLIRLGSKQ